MMGAAAGLHGDTTRRPVGEERHKLGAFEYLAVNRASIWLDIVNLENALGQVDGNGFRDARFTEAGGCASVVPGVAPLCFESARRCESSA
uniref:hypothetical protein n=1 Tax=Paraburkholderia franconis TaxID=2654983 RepID=UPI00187B9467